MRNTTSILLSASFIFLLACSPAKKTSTSAAAAPVTPAPPAAAASPIMMAKSPDGIYPPGNDELAALQTRYSDVTLAQLSEGHTLYTQSACIGCHKPKNIYKYDEASWKGIIDNMAIQAKITTAQKDAVYKYVLAIKAVQPK